jgi:hypothetical protein
LPGLQNCSRGVPLHQESETQPRNSKSAACISDG